MGFINSTTNT